jgi:nucleoside-diphosphate-sugar epimerase
MRVLVIGGTRFIGPRVVRRLVKAGHEVGVFYRGAHEVALPTVVRRFRDPRAAIPVTQIPEQLRAYAPDIVVHMIGVARRIVALSSGDVYRAYGIFKGCDEGPVEKELLTESSPLRAKLFPYRTQETPRDALEYSYDKILVERALAADAKLPATILRLPKVYGPEDNANLATVYAFRNHPDWRWTHGYVDNVAQAIVQAVENDRAIGQTYNVGEQITPTVAERLAYLPANLNVPISDLKANFAQDIGFDTSLIRAELNYREEMGERESMTRIAVAAAKTSQSSA